jgi:glycosyltransferase involved in cell wall biosynthesis
MTIGGNSVVHVIRALLDGGSERRLEDAIRANPDVESIVYCGEGPGERMKARLDGICEIRHAPGLVREVSPRNDAALVRWLRRELAAVGPDLVHSHQSKAGILARVAAPRGVPIVHSYSMANFGPGFERVPSLTFQGLEWATQRRVAMFVVPGAELAIRLRTVGVPDERVQVVRSSIDTARFERVGPARPPGSGPVRVLYVGTIDERKGVLDLPAVMARVAELSGRPIHLSVAGTGELEGRLDEALRTAGVPGLTWELLGFRSDVPELMAGSHVLVLPSSAEGLPQVLVQAAAVQLPFVSYAVDGVDELIGMGAAGRKVELGNPRAMGDAVAGIVAGGSRARTGVDFSSWDQAKVLWAYRQLYQRLMDPIG